MATMKPIYGRTIETVRRQLIGGQTYYRVGTDINEKISVETFAIKGVPYKHPSVKRWFIKVIGMANRHSLHDDGILHGHNNKKAFVVRATPRNSRIVRDIVARQDHLLFDAVIDQKRISG